MNSYGVGNLIRLSVTFTELVGQTPIDPTDVTLYIQNPDGTVDEFTYLDSQIVRDGVGLYHYDLPNPESGYYYYRFEGSGTIVAASNGQFNSIPSPFGSL